LHLAAQASVSRSVEAPLESAAANILGFLTVLEACRKREVPRLVYGSSAAAAGEGALGHPRSPYGLEKSTNERHAALCRELHGYGSLGLRYFNVYGPRRETAPGSAGVLVRFAALAGAGRPLTVYGDGRQRRDFIHVGDVARANVRALGRTANGILDVGTGVATSVNEVVKLLRELAGRRLAVSRASAEPGGLRNSCAEVVAARRALGRFDRVSLRAGLAELIAFAATSGRR
jgi:UDP-glucose 4-epimerase